MYLLVLSILKRSIVSVLFLICTIDSSAQQTEITNKFGMQFVHIQPGTMLVGKYAPTVSRGWGYDPKRKSEFPQILPEADFELAEQLASAASRPGFLVSIDKPYYIGKFEVTQIGRASCRERV